MIEQWFWFNLIWSIKSTLINENRRDANLCVREVESQFPSKNTIYDYL
jgi:dynein heavy chain